MIDLPCFNRVQIRTVRAARNRAAALVSHYYRVAPREWNRMRYEVKTLRSLDSAEITDRALAHIFCYGFRRQAADVVLEEGDLYRICLQDHRILDAAIDSGGHLNALLTYILTHELVHVVRFGQRLQRVDLPYELRDQEEGKVESTTRAILSAQNDSKIARILSSRPVWPH